MGYVLEGKMAEACSCHGPCPCWIGDDPDGGECEGLIAYHYERGTIDGTDVSGQTLALLAQIPGNVLKGNWRVVAFVSDTATPEQKQAILAAHTGQLGGPLADLSQLVGEVVGVYDAPIHFDMKDGRGTMRVGAAVALEMEPYSDAQGRLTKLVDAIFNTIPGSPAYLGRSVEYRADVPEHGMTWSFSRRSSVVADFRLEG